MLSEYLNGKEKNFTIREKNINIIVKSTVSSVRGKKEFIQAVPQSIWMQMANDYIYTDKKSSIFSSNASKSYDIYVYNDTLFKMVLDVISVNKSFTDEEGEFHPYEISLLLHFRK